ncbi:hypothetical protein [Burkholderia sp. AU32262]|uniref:hypothetical protein n=1 Tax=Burkholderia sp. AU32262 TaxID=2879630 RepID=UPI001CF402AA|nr:hypothetical protein [Burkholderia sp. AU32262]MCA8242851.1 hypothetical protein [Burkholderia sp. AU32262]
MNCKPGDLAFTVGSPLHEQNGMVVQVVGLSPRGAPWWVVSFRGAVETREGLIAHGRAQVRDANLRPISGVPVTDDIEDEVTA